jgi:hypothetical protein
MRHPASGGFYLSLLRWKLLVVRCASLSEIVLTWGHIRLASGGEGYSVKMSLSKASFFMEHSLSLVVLK